MEELPQVTFIETVTSIVWNYLSLDTGLLHKKTICNLPLRKGFTELWTQLGEKGEGRKPKSWKGFTSTLLTPIIHALSVEHRRSLQFRIINRPHTSEYLNSSARFIPSVCRMSSFSPCLLVLSFNKHRVIPFTSWMTVFRARERSKEERSKYTFISGSANET